MSLFINRMAIRLFLPLIWWFVISGGLVFGLYLIVSFERNENSELSTKLSNAKWEARLYKTCPDSLRSLDWRNVSDLSTIFVDDQLVWTLDTNGGVNTYKILYLRGWRFYRDPCQLSQANTTVSHWAKLN